MSEIGYFYLIAISFFLLDNCLVFFFKKNILNFGYGPDHPETSLANAIVFVFILSFSISFFFPAIRIVIIYVLIKLYTHIYLEFIAPIIDRLFGYKGESPDNRYISIVELQAVRERDEFTLKRVANAREIHARINNLMNLEFAWACLLAINLFLVGENGSLSISRQLTYFICEGYSLNTEHISCIIYWLFIGLIFLAAVYALKPEVDIVIYAPREVNKKS